jgi:hypothetical protein
MNAAWSSETSVSYHITIQHRITVETSYLSSFDMFCSICSAGITDDVTHPCHTRDLVYCFSCPMPQEPSVWKPLRSTQRQVAARNFSRLERVIRKKPESSCSFHCSNYSCCLLLSAAVWSKYKLRLSSFCTAILQLKLSHFYTQRLRRTERHRLPWVSLSAD